MIDRNPKAGQCVHVGMKRMTEVASTLWETVPYGERSMNQPLERPNATTVIVPDVS